MIKKKQMFYAECDMCQVLFNTECNDYDVFPTKKEIKEVIVDEGWTIKKKKTLCPDCSERLPSSEVRGKKE